MVVRSDTVEISFEKVSMTPLTWLAVIFPTLLPFITESKIGTISYNPQRVMRLLGYDQLVIQVT